MLFADGTLGLVLFALWLFCIIDVITTDELAIRYLPKLVWLLIVLLLPDIGSIAWLIAGHPWNAPRSSRAAQGSAPGFPEYDRPGRHVAASADDDAEFLAQVRRRAEAQRREYQARRKAELDADQDRLLRRPEDDPQS